MCRLVVFVPPTSFRPRSHPGRKRPNASKSVVVDRRPELRPANRSRSDNSTPDARTTLGEIITEKKRKPRHLALASRQREFAAENVKSPAQSARRGGRRLSGFRRDQFLDPM